MLICIGEILVDIFQDGNKEEVHPGGAPFNVACNALLYTDKVSFFGAVGKDSYGELLIDTLSKKNFTHPYIKVCDDRYTSKAIVSLKNGERSFRFERDFGADYALDINDIDISFIHDEDIVHIGSLMLSFPVGREFFYQLIKEIREKTHAKISFDINYRDDIFSSPNEAKDIFLKAMKEVDILKFSEEEVSLFSKKQDIKEALKEILNDKQIAVVTLGAKGSLYYHHGHIVKVDTFPVKPIDTTGAGDAFYSYFLASIVNYPNFVRDDKEIAHYLLRANVAGGLTALKIGAIDASPTKEEIERYINKN